MKNNKVMKITLSAVFAAIICVATMFLMVPLPGSGYANFGDCFVLVGAFVLGPWYGAAAAGIGAGLSDLLLGYGIYAPATLIIKALMAMVAYAVYKNMEKKGVSSVWATLPAVILAELVMIFGYFLFEIPLYGMETALLDVIGNGIQGAVGALSGFLVYHSLYKTRILRNRVFL